MHYYLALTSKCNLLCKYCYGKTSEDFLTPEEQLKYDLNLPPKLNFSTEQLKKFSLDDSNFALTFYGGEPLMEINKITEIMDEIPCKTFMLQTNGLFLHKLPKKYINQMNTILVSIDGIKEHTDDRRGKGVYDKVLKNIQLIRENGFKGEIIARMTVDETSNIYENVIHLYSLIKKGLFNSIHWQLDALFWKSDYKDRNFKPWSITNYNPNIKKLIDWWINIIQTENKIPLLYPFVGIMYRILYNYTKPMPCGAGHSLIGIQTNGEIVACPITAGYKPFSMGNIKHSTLKEIKSKELFPKNNCESCNIKDICGGRCLYANDTKLWGEKGFNEVCNTIFYLVNNLKVQVPKIEKLISENKLQKEDFKYNLYNGCEIIP